jgi:phytoene desaturase (3,4-didehydrolycopene-forming)
LGGFVIDSRCNRRSARQDSRWLARGSRLEYSCGVLAYYFCLKGQVPGLLQHNVFLSEDYKGSWDRPCFPEDLKPERQVNFYVHNPSYTDTTTGA